MWFLELYKLCINSSSTELRRGVGQPEDRGGEDESSAPRPEQRRFAAQEKPRLSQQDLPSALQWIPDGCGGADRSCQESAGLAGQVDTLSLTHTHLNSEQLLSFVIVFQIICQAYSYTVVSIQTSEAS